MHKGQMTHAGRRERGVARGAVHHRDLGQGRCVFWLSVESRKRLRGWSALAGSATNRLTMRFGAKRSPIVGSHSGPAKFARAPQISRPQRRTITLARSTMADPSSLHSPHRVRSRSAQHATATATGGDLLCRPRDRLHVGFVTGPSASSRTGLWRPKLSRCQEPYSATASSG